VGVKMKNKQMDYDEEVFDIDDLDDLDVKINPSYYIHHAFLKLQNALIKDDWKAGFMQYRQLIEHLEIICKNTNLINEAEYQKSMDEFLKSKEFKTWQKENKESLAELLKVGDKKLSLLMKSVFENKAISSPLENMKKDPK
jgi:hypothetical protein